MLFYSPLLFFILFALQNHRYCALFLIISSRNTIFVEDNIQKIITFLSLYCIFQRLFLSGWRSKAIGHEAKGSALHCCQLCQEGCLLPTCLATPAPPQALATLGNSAWWSRKWQVTSHQLHLQHDDGHFSKGRRRPQLPTCRPHLFHWRSLCKHQWANSALFIRV